MFKYIGLILKFSDISSTYQEEKKAGRPFWLSRSFIGSLIAFIATGITVFFGIEIGDKQIEVIVNSISTIIPAVVALYGVILTFVGQVKSKKTDAPCLPTNPTDPIV